MFFFFLFMVGLPDIKFFFFFYFFIAFIAHIHVAFKQLFTHVHSSPYVLAVCVCVCVCVFLFFFELSAHITFTSLISPSFSLAATISTTTKEGKKDLPAQQPLPCSLFFFFFF